MKAFLKSPPVVALIVFAFCILLIRPFGEYPLNDDWQYSWITWQLAKTGHYHSDIAIAPSLVLQAYLGAFFVKVIGFSHLLLRALTWSVCGVLFFCVDRIMKLASARYATRIAVLLTICLNSLFLNLGNSYMTEIYGNTIGLLGVVVWFGSRQKNCRKNFEISQSAISWKSALASGLIFGASFWVRQTIILLLPCLGLATLAGVVASRGWRKSLPTLWRVLAAGAVAGFIALSYFIWARATGNFTETFAEPLALLTQVDLEILPLQFTAMGFYMTAFLFPLLLALPRSTFFSARRAGLAVVFFLAALYGLSCFQGVASPSSGAAAWLHPVFPLVGNIVLDAGVGPITLAETYNLVEPFGLMRPRWGDSVWWPITIVILLILPLWAGVLTEIGARLFRKMEAFPLEWEIALFGALVAPAMTLLLSQAFETHVLDRYHFPGFLCSVICLGIVLDQASLKSSACASVVGIRRWALCLLPLALFSIAGMHDYFRWNDARWEVVNEHQNVDPWELYAGHEAWNWLGLTRWAGYPEKPRIGRKMIIGMNPIPGYRVIDTLPVSGWLAKTPDLLLEELAAGQPSGSR